MSAMVAPPEAATLEELESFTSRINRALQEVPRNTYATIAGQEVELTNMDSAIQSLVVTGVHDQLTGVEDSIKHALFLLLDGSRAMTGNLQMATHEINWRGSSANRIRSQAPNYMNVEATTGIYFDINTGHEMLLTSTALTLSDVNLDVDYHDVQNVNTLHFDVGGPEMTFGLLDVAGVGTTVTMLSDTAATGKFTGDGGSGLWVDTLSLGYGGNEMTLAMNGADAEFDLDTAAYFKFLKDVLFVEDVGMNVAAPLCGFHFEPEIESVAWSDGNTRNTAAYFKKNITTADLVAALSGLFGADVYWSGGSNGENVNSMFFNLSLNGASTYAGGAQRGVVGSTTINSSGVAFTTSCVGMQGKLFIDGTYDSTMVNAAGQIALEAWVSIAGTDGGSIDKVIGLKTRGSFAGAATIDDYYGIWVTDASGATLPTDQIGIYIEDMTQASGTDVGIRVDGADTYALWLGAGADNTGPADGITFGASADVNLYRGGADLLKTDDDLLSHTSAKHYFDAGAAAGTEWISADTDTYIDTHFGGGGARFTNLGNLLLTVRPYDAGNPGFPVLEFPDTFDMNIGATTLWRFRTNYLSCYKSLQMVTNSYVALSGDMIVATPNRYRFIFGTGWDAYIGYTGSHFLVVPNSVGAGWLYVGETGTAEAVAGKWHTTTAGTEYAYSSGAGNYSIEAGTLIELNAAASFSSGMRLEQATISAAATLTAAHYIVLCDTDTAGAPFTVTLPAAASHADRLYYIKNTGTSGHDVTVDGNAAETIDGAATQPVIDGNCLEIVCDGTGWWVI